MEQTPPVVVPARKRTGLYIALAVVVVLALAGAAFGVSRVVAGQQAAATATAQYVHDYGACGVVVVQDAVTNLRDISDRFSDVYDLASATGRGALSPVVGDMQDIKQEAQDVSVPVCLASTKSALVAGISYTIDGFIAFMAQETDANVSAHFRDAAASLGQYNDGVSRVLQCAPDC